MARCFVTGHKGYIGSRLYKELVAQGHDVRGIDLNINSKIMMPGDEDILEGLGQYEDFAPEYIFHMACIPRVAYSVEQPVHTMINNVISTSIVLDFARKVGAKRVIYSGSSSVVGNGDGPASPYGLQKFVSELETKLYSELYGVDTVTLRYFNVYSPCQKASGPYATAIANFMEFIRKEKNPFITGNGEQKRDMSHLEDVVSANIFAMEHDGEFGGKHYDVGTGENISLNEIKDIVLEFFENVEFQYIEDREGDVFLTKANMEPLKELGWAPKRNVREGIRECFKLLKKESGPDFKRGQE
jgi:nucleoside-diphosphate-sugar epimerase